MKILITYFSVTENTAEIARAIYEETLSQGHSADLRILSDVLIDNLNDYALLFVGSACHDTDLAKPVKQFLDALPMQSSFQLAGFVTHATHMPDDGGKAADYYQSWAGRCLPTFQHASKNKNIPFLAYYHCQGAPSSRIADFIHSQIVTDDEEWKAYYNEVMRHPDENDVLKAQVFARDVLSHWNHGQQGRSGG